MTSRSEPRLLLIRNRAGVSSPFSLEKLSTNLMTSGVDVRMAHAIADDILGGLQPGDQILTSSDVADRATTLLAERAGPVAAERYAAWRRFKHSGRPLVLCILGAPGVGKSTAALQLALRLGLHRTIPTEGIREVMRTLVPDTVLPELHVAAHDAADNRDGSKPNGFLRQARAVTSAALSVAESAVRERRSVAVVGSHLLPGAMRDAFERNCSDAVVLEVLLTLEDRELHRASMLRNTRSDPANPGVRHIRNFQAVRALQSEFQHMANAAGVVAQDLANPETLTAFVVDRVAQADALHSAMAADAS